MSRDGDLALSHQACLAKLAKAGSPPNAIITFTNRLEKHREIMPLSNWNENYPFGVSPPDPIREIKYIYSFVTRAFEQKVLSYQADWNTDLLQGHPSPTTSCYNGRMYNVKAVLTPLSAPKVNMR